MDNLNEIKNQEHEGNHYISCRTGQGVAEMKKIIENNIYEKLNYIRLKLKIEQGSDEMAFLYKYSVIKEIDEYQDSQYILMSVIVNKVNAIKLIKLFPNIELIK